MSEERNSEQHQEQRDFSFGKRLASARSALNLSRQEVAKELRLGLAVITALEEEDYEKLSVPIFVTGYLRNYARLLKIPAEPLLAAYNQVQVAMPIVISEAVKKPKPSYSKLSVRISSLLIVLVLVAGIISWLQQQDFELSSITSFNESSATEPTTSLLPLIALPELAELPKLNESAELSVEKMPEVSPVVVEPPIPVVKPENKVLIRVSEKSWVEVSDSDGKRLIYDLLRVNKEYWLSGNSPFKVFLGNAKAVRIEYNGEPVNIKQYIRGNLARFKLGVAGE